MEGGESIYPAIDGKTLEHLIMFNIYPRLYCLDSNETRTSELLHSSQSRTIKVASVSLCPKGVTPRTSFGRIGESICCNEYYKLLFSPMSFWLVGK